MRKFVAAAMFCLMGGSVLAQVPATVTLPDPNVFPENVTTLADGTVVIGAMLQPYIYRARPGQTTAERWIDLSGAGSASWGLVPDAKSNTLWVCTVAFPLPATRTPPVAERNSSLRGFDLTTGAPKAVYQLLGATNACNDITVGPDGTIYLSDLANGQIQRLRPGARTLEVWLKTPELANIDGIAFVGPTLYVNNVQTSKLYRIPIAQNGAAGNPVEIALSQPLDGPDGMRAHSNGKLYVAENRANRVSEITFDGDRGTVRVVKGGYGTATGVQPHGNILWVQESKQHYWRDPALANADPNPFRIYAVEIPR